MDAAACAVGFSHGLLRTFQDMWSEAALPAVQILQKAAAWCPNAEKVFVSPTGQVVDPEIVQQHVSSDAGQDDSQAQGSTDKRCSSDDATATHTHTAHPPVSPSINFPQSVAKRWHGLTWCVKTLCL